MRYTLVTANRNYSSWSLRPWVLMRALGLDFEDRIVAFGGASNFDKFREFAPNAMVPCLYDDGTAIWDSLGIVEYLAERHKGVWPDDAVARAWGRCASAEMHSGFAALRSTCPMNVGVRARLHRIGPELKKDMNRIAELWAEGLERFGGPWLAGDSFSAVDAFFAPVVFRVRSFDLDVGEASQPWVARMLSFPAMREWEEVALAESWRETAHEEEIAAVATIIQDFRETA